MTCTSFTPSGPTRRRAICILAGAMTLPGHLAAREGARASVQRWHGTALGADVSLELHDATPEDLVAARRYLHRFEEQFSLYRAQSELSRLNAAGGGPISRAMADILHLSDRVHRLTGGLFDPTIQGVFETLLAGGAPDWQSVGWHQVRLSRAAVHYGPGQKLSLNGIAQGVATDGVVTLLKRRGLSHALVSVGEHAALGGPFRLGLEDPVHGHVGHVTLTDRAVATSSPGAMRLGPHSHILRPDGGRPVWSTVSVTGDSAAVADALSTALCLAPEAEVARVARQTGVSVTLVDTAGDVARFG